MNFSKGHYLLLIPSSYTSEGENAFVSINLKSSTNLCEIRFWYWISDDSVGSINVYYRKAIGSNLELLKSLKSAQTNTWERANMMIPESEDSLQV